MKIRVHGELVDMGDQNTYVLQRTTSGVSISEFKILNLSDGGVSYWAAVKAGKEVCTGVSARDVATRLEARGVEAGWIYEPNLRAMIPGDRYL